MIQSSQFYGYTVMSSLMSQIRSLFRPVSKVRGSNNNSEVFLRRVRLCLLTAVAGYDNKHTKYSTRISPKWVYGDDACFLSVTDSSYVLGNIFRILTIKLFYQSTLSFLFHTKCYVLCLLGVADGVGGWRSYGVDPGRFSRAVMKNCERVVNSGRFIPDKLEVLIAQCYEDVLNSKELILGSATLCIVSLQRNEHRVYGASLGDSGYLVIREGHVIQRSVHQKHSFNTPFQLSCPPTLRSRRFHCDLPNQAAQTSVEVKPGDVIIVGTDGLFDNLTESMILQEIKTIEVSCVYLFGKIYQLHLKINEKFGLHISSATLCIVSLQRNEHRVYGASLGDSGYLVIREGHVIQRSVHQKHSFNTPFQLSCPPTLRSRRFHCDLPNQAAQTSVEVKPGDVIIVGTDGLFDNLTESMILQEIKTIE
ncbi:protein phosphatase PTC7, partial [Schistosoma bovis]